jgi:hypothetical protein
MAGDRHPGCVARSYARGFWARLSAHEVAPAETGRELGLRTLEVGPPVTARCWYVLKILGSVLEIASP